MMVGREVFLDIKKPKIIRGEKRLSVKDLTYVSETGRPVLKGVDFNLYSGEVLALPELKAMARLNWLRS